MDRAQREGYHFGAKLVRGAYMFLERARAEQKGYPSPIRETIEDTHLNYNRWAHQPVWLPPGCRQSWIAGPASDPFFGGTS